MSDVRERLYELVPAVYRLRDAERGDPLRALLAVISEQVGELEENLAQLYDDQFVETASEWVVPYIGDLVGYRALNNNVGNVGSERAQVANTIGYRRRKGTLTVIEQLARDVTDWDARAVEYFQLLSTTQYMNHIRLHNVVTPDLRKWQPLERLNTPFETTPHTLDVRNIGSGRGKYNIPNIGIFLFRLRAYRLTQMPATKLDDHRYFLSPLGSNTVLYNRPETERQANGPSSITALATPRTVPMPLSRRVLHEFLDAYYGRGESLLLQKDGNAVDAADIVVCDLSDVSGGWAHDPPTGKIAVDPLLGRIAISSADAAPEALVVSYHYGFSADMGGGEYPRADSFDDAALPVRNVSGGASVQTELDALTEGGAVEIGDSGRYEETISISAPANSRTELRAGNNNRPHLRLGGEMVIKGDENAVVTLNGLLVSGGGLRIAGDISTVRIRHCTLVPGQTLNADGTPVSPDAPSILVDAAAVTLEIDHSTVGAIRIPDTARVVITDSIVDATEDTRAVYAALDGESAGATLVVKNSTVIGKVYTRELELASNSIFLARLAESDTWDAPVISTRKQAGCVRFSYVPFFSQTPRRYRCQPASPADQVKMRPQFTSLRYGEAGYCQLSRRTAQEIRTGADDGSEMGAFHDLFQPQRESNLRIRLDEYLRFGMEAGILYAS